MTTEELGLKLKDMYENAPKGNKVAYIHYFGIKFAEEINKNSLGEVVKYQIYLKVMRLKYQRLFLWLMY